MPSLIAGIYKWFNAVNVKLMFIKNINVFSKLFTRGPIFVLYYITIYSWLLRIYENIR